MLDENTNNVTWVGIATGVVAALGLASMAMFPSAMSSAKNNMTGMVSHFSKAGSDVSKSSGTVSSDTVNTIQLVTGSKLTPMKFKALFGESTLGDKNYQTLDLNQNQRTRVFDNAEFLKLYDKVYSYNDSAPADSDSVVSVPDYLQHQTDIPDGKVANAYSYILDANNQKVDIANVSDSGNYHVGLTIDSGGAGDTLKIQYINAVLSGSDLKDLNQKFQSQAGGAISFSGGQFTASPNMMITKQVADEFATPDVKAQFSVLSPEDRQYLIDYEYAMSVVNAMRGQDDKGPYSDGDLRAVFTYQGDQSSD